MTIEPDTKNEGLFIAHGTVFERNIVAEGSSHADAFCEFIAAAKENMAVFPPMLKEQAQ